MQDPFHLKRFVEAQDPIYPSVVNELRRGMKQGHWMWFVFPQLSGLGESPTSKKYAISGLAEAKDYLAHPILGPRLRECSQIVAGIKNRSIHVVLGFPDDAKLQSSMTLFAAASQEREDFLNVLKVHYRGLPDEKTLRLLREQRGN